MRLHRSWPRARPTPTRRSTPAAPTDALRPNDPTASDRPRLLRRRLSHAVAFELSGLVEPRRSWTRSPAGRASPLATDGETFGHHHHWGDRLLAYALTVEAPGRGVEVVNAQHVRWRPTTTNAIEVRIRESAWSCAHGVGRWREDCGCSTGGEPGWHQRWRAPLRPALDVAAGPASRSFERRGRAVLRDPWAARDDYVPRAHRRRSADDFAGQHVIGDRVEAFTLLEASATRWPCTRRAAGSSTTSPASRPCRSCGTRPGCSACLTSWASTRHEGEFLDAAGQGREQ